MVLMLNLALVETKQITILGWGGRVVQILLPAVQVEITLTTEMTKRGGGLVNKASLNLLNIDDRKILASRKKVSCTFNNIMRWWQSRSSLVAEPASSKAVLQFESRPDIQAGLFGELYSKKKR
jgi:hypothetical protein